MVCNLILLFKGYVISLHRLSIGEGEIQGGKDKKAKTRRTNEEIDRFNLLFLLLVFNSCITT